MSFVSYQTADAVADRFLTLLSRLGVAPPPESAIEDELLSTVALMDSLGSTPVPPGADPDMLRYAAGLHDLAAKVLSAERLPEFSGLHAHLKLLGRTALPTDTALQNAKATMANDTNRKLTELYLAALAVHLGTDLALDSPTSAKGDNPDVIFRPSEDPAHLWALAIKSVSGKSGQTYFERIADAVRQIEASRVDRGLIVINTKDTLDHAALWAPVFPDALAAVNALRVQVETVIDKAKQDRPLEEWDALFTGKAVRPILFLGQSVARVTTAHHAETPTALKMLCAFDGCGTVDPVGEPLAKAMNHMMQTILTGTPGGAGKQPS